MLVVQYQTQNFRWLRRPEAMSSVLVTKKKTLAEPWFKVRNDVAK